MTPSSVGIKNFKKKIWDFYASEGRHALPWRKKITPYRIVVSEVMLQQTQVDRVIPKFQEFLKTFPNFETLSQASVAEVVAAWKGLGYNRRALHLHRIARQVVKEFKGRLPKNPAELQKLPGIGKATAASITAFAFNESVVFIETNIRRVFIHSFFHDREGVSDDELLPLIETSLDPKRSREWYWALMDYGSVLGKTLKANPNRKSAHYVKQSKFQGSRRQVRGLILKELLAKKSISLKEAALLARRPVAEIQPILNALTAEGFLKYKRNRWHLS